MQIVALEELARRALALLQPLCDCIHAAEYFANVGDAGADFITTQLFFDNDVYHRFVDKCRAAGITVPIVPGIMPVLSLKQIQRFTQMCGASLPARLTTRLEAAADHAEVVETIGIDWALGQIREVLSARL